jgi:hypothetical protein
LGVDFFLGAAFLVVAFLRFVCFFSLFFLVAIFAV